MPNALIALLDQLDRTAWKTPSSGRKTEGPTARRTEGQAAVNIHVLDHIAEAREVAVRVAKLAAENSPLAQREAHALEDAEVMRLKAVFLKETSLVRQHACPACGCWTLLLAKDNRRAFCVNRHCARVGIQRRWTLKDLLVSGAGTPQRPTVTTNTTRDQVTVDQLVAFFAPTAYPTPASTLRLILKTYGIRAWGVPKSKSLTYSLSDVARAHAFHMAKRKPTTCARPHAIPACTGLADDLFFGAVQVKQVEAAKELCAACPLLDLCRTQALAAPIHEQHGVAGGMTARERINAIRDSRA